METRSLGSSALRVTVVGLGCNNFGGRCDLAASRQVVHKALDAGITLFDTADIYGNRGGSESQLGEILGPRRRDIVLASKFGKAMDADGKMRGAAPAYIRRALDASLTRLKTDWIDLYQIHEPDPATPIAETLGTLEALTRAGKIRAYGCSNFAADELRAAQDAAQALGVTGFVTFQDEYNLLNRAIETELIPAAARSGMSLLPFYPLASGFLTGKYPPGAPPPPGTRLAGGGRAAERLLSEKNWRTVDALRAFCDARGRALLELAVSWLACRSPVASVIAGATKPEQVEANIAAAGWRLTPADMAAIDRITTGTTPGATTGATTGAARAQPA